MWEIGKSEQFSPRTIRSIASTFRVSLHSAARRVCELGLWKGDIGLWDLGSATKELWYVGRRPWSRTPRFAAFDMVKGSSSEIKTREIISAGESEQMVALHLLNIGQNKVLGFVKN